MGGATPGDQYVLIEIVNPRADSDRAREIYEQMAKELAFNPRAQWGAL